MEDYYCEICDKQIDIESKSKLLASKSHIEKSKCDRIVLSFKDVDIDEKDEVYSLYISEHKKKHVYCKIKCQYKVIFDNGQHTDYITARVFDNRTKIG